MQFCLQQWHISLQKLDPYYAFNVTTDVKKHDTHLPENCTIQMLNSEKMFSYFLRLKDQMFNYWSAPWHLRLRLKQTLSHMKRWKARFILVNWFVQTVLVNEQISKRFNISKWHFMSFFYQHVQLSYINCFIYLFISSTNNLLKFDIVNLISIFIHLNTPIGIIKKYTEQSFTL